MAVPSFPCEHGGMECTGCRAQIDGATARSLAISVEALGDEVSYRWWRCPECGAWTEERVWDRFLGPEERSIHGPIDDAAMAPLVDALPRCPAPWDNTAIAPRTATWEAPERPPWSDVRIREPEASAGRRTGGSDARGLPAPPPAMRRPGGPPRRCPRTPGTPRTPCRQPPAPRRGPGAPHARDAPHAPDVKRCWPCGVLTTGSTPYRRVPLGLRPTDVARVVLHLSRRYPCDDDAGFLERLVHHGVRPHVDAVGEGDAAEHLGFTGLEDDVVADGRTSVGPCFSPTTTPTLIRRLAPMRAFGWITIRAVMRDEQARTDRIGGDGETEPQAQSLEPPAAVVPKRAREPGSPAVRLVLQLPQRPLERPDRIDDEQPGPLALPTQRGPIGFEVGQVVTSRLDHRSVARLPCRHGPPGPEASPPFPEYAPTQRMGRGLRGGRGGEGQRGRGRRRGRGHGHRRACGEAIVRASGTSRATQAAYRRRATGGRGRSRPPPATRAPTRRWGRRSPWTRRSTPSSS